MRRNGRRGDPAPQGLQGDPEEFHGRQRGQASQFGNGQVLIGRAELAIGVGWHRRREEVERRVRLREG
jgi:hypothetical protein